MKVRKTTKVLILFIVVLLLSVYAAMKISDYRGIKAVEKAERAKRSLTKPNINSPIIKIGIRNGKVQTLKMDTVVISPDGDTMHSSSTSVNVSW